VPSNCTSKGYVEPWKLVTLKPCVALYFYCDVEYDENDWGEYNNDLVVGLRIRNNFFVVTTPGHYEGVDFFILQCVKELHIVEEDSRLNDFGNSIEKGDEIIISQYYKQSSRRKVIICVD
jgi:hypothetical protein